MVLRFVLGVVEAAVMPSMLMYISRWFTRTERSRANTFLILGNPVTVLWMSLVVGLSVHNFGWREMSSLKAPGGRMRRLVVHVKVVRRCALDERRRKRSNSTRASSRASPHCSGARLQSDADRDRAE